MQASDRVEFAQAITALAASFRAESDEAMLEGYWWALDDLPLEAVQRAVRSAMRQCKFMPAAFELRELSGVMSNQARAVLAWAAFEKAVRIHGGYETINFDDPLINATVRNLGGWERCCLLPCEEFDKWLRKDFERVYLALLSSGVSAEAAAPLIGVFDRENLLTGYEGRKPVLFVTGLPAHQRQLVHGSVRVERLPGSEPKSIGRIFQLTPPDAGKDRT